MISAEIYHTATRPRSRTHARTARHDKMSGFDYTHPTSDILRIAFAYCILAILVEAYAELPDHGNVSACCHGLHESFGARLGDGAQVVDELVLSHADAGILNGDCGVGLVGDDFDEEVWLRFDLVGICDRFVADLIKRIGGIGDQLSQEDLFVGVEGVDDQAHQLLDVGIEGKCLCHGWEGVCSRRGKIKDGVSTCKCKIEARA